MKDTALELSKLLRDPDGEYKCDLIVALTHARYAPLPLSNLDNVREPPHFSMINLN